MEDKKIGVEIKNVDSMIGRKIMSLTKEYGLSLTPIQISIINYISDNKKINQKDIEKYFNLRKSTISGILQTMERNGLINRNGSLNDARSKEITLTDKCISMKLFIIEKAKEFELSLTNGITKEELKTFFEVMNKIKNNLMEDEYV